MIFLGQKSLTWVLASLAGASCIYSLTRPLDRPYTHPLRASVESKYEIGLERGIRNELTSFFGRESDTLTVRTIPYDSSHPYSYSQEMKIDSYGRVVALRVCRFQKNISGVEETCKDYRLGQRGSDHHLVAATLNAQRYIRRLQELPKPPKQSRTFDLRAIDE